MYRSAPIVVFVLWVLWKGLGEKEHLSLLDDGAVLFHSLLCFPFFSFFCGGFLWPDQVGAGWGILIPWGFHSCVKFEVFFCFFYWKYSQA